MVTVVLSTLDFGRAAISFDADAMKKAFKSSLNRLIACAILIILPIAIQLILGFAEIPLISSTNPLCK
ncbi:hypothetical protein D3C80_1962660 [compost metagenome]